MSNGPSLPASVLSTRTMPIVPVSDDASSDYNCTSAPPSPPSKSHPHPLRSHSSENLHCHKRTKSVRSVQTKHSSQSSVASRPDSCISRPNRGSIYGAGGDGSYEIIEDYEAPPPMPSPIHPAFRRSVSSTERFGDAAVPRSPGTNAVKDYPVVSSRPPLKPTISFGGESRMSYYSLASSAMDEKSKAIAAEERLQMEQRNRRKNANRGGKVLACFGITCLQRRRPLKTSHSMPNMAELPG